MPIKGNRFPGRHGVPSSSSWLSHRPPTEPALIIACLVGWLNLGLSQEAVLFSRAGETAAQARKQNSATSQHSILQTGPFAVDMSAGIELEANDNILLVPTQGEGDLILRPHVRSRVGWQASQSNLLQLNLDGGYSCYLAHARMNRVFLQPGSELSFDLYAGDLWINLHDRLSISENVYEDPTVTSRGNYSQLQNTSGFTTTWDLQKLEINAGYDHCHYVGVSGGSALPSGRSEVFALNTSIDPGLPMRVGTQLGAGLIHYASTLIVQDSLNLSAGAFIRGRPLQYVTVEAAAGYTTYSSSAARSSAINAFYGQLALHQKINRYFEFDLSGGRTVSFGFYTGTVDLYNLTWATRVHCFRKLAVSAGVVFEHGVEIFAGHESFDRFGPHLTVERSFGHNFSAALIYQFFKRQSGIFGGNYDINILQASLAYQL